MAMIIVANARELGLDPEMELRAARRYDNLVHAWERSPNRAKQRQ